MVTRRARHTVLLGQRGRSLSGATGPLRVKRVSPMFDVRSLKWLMVGVFVGLAFLAIGSLAKTPARKVTPTTSPAPATHARQEERGDAGLRIECRNDDECIKTSLSDWNDGQGPLRRKFLRVRVYNDGTRTAEHCRVLLRGVSEVTPNGPVSADYKGPGLLLWSGDGSRSVDTKSIRRNGNPEVVDLFYTVHHPAGDKIYLKDERYSAFLKFGRSYDFEIVVISGDTNSVAENVRVRFGPLWDDFEVVDE